jgi:hypothetical protein
LLHGSEVRVHVQEKPVDLLAGLSDEGHDGKRIAQWRIKDESVGTGPIRVFSVLSKLKCPVFVASEMSGFKV